VYEQPTASNAEIPSNCPKYRTEGPGDLSLVCPETGLICGILAPTEGVKSSGGR
jgi:hypothetical protein